MILVSIEAVLIREEDMKGFVEEDLAVMNDMKQVYRMDGIYRMGDTYLL